MGIPSGLWTSSGGSRLHIEIGPDNVVTGQYATMHGRAGPDEFYPITGYVNEDMIGFVCSWGPHASVSTWCGRMIENESGKCLHVVWHLGRQFADTAHTIPNEITFTFHTNAGKFYYQA